MNKQFQLAAAGLMFCGWVVYLAGVANSNSICNKVGKGDLTALDLISSTDDASKSFMPLNDPWTIPTNTNPMLNRKLMGDELFPTNARALMGVSEDRCGWTYSFAWWTVSLQGFATILALLVASGGLSSMRHAVGPLLYVNTALLCAVAASVVPVAANYGVTKTKGKWPSSVATVSAGLIITLVSNFFYFFADAPVEPVGGHAQPAEAK